jgi:hypothetical protein
MEKVNNLMKSLKLSEVESKGLKIGWTDGAKVGVVDLQAMGKLLSDRPEYIPGMTTSLGNIWCPMKGVHIKDLGEISFMFTFGQESGKNKALLEGPWSFNNALLVMEDFDPIKTLTDYEFCFVPIWVRVFDLPLGIMNRDTGESIGGEIGEFMEADVDENGMAIGKYLKVKVRINIKKPLMRGIMLDLGEGRTGHWCRFEYEFLPDFCFRCGMLDHIDRDCKIILGRGEKPQFGSWLKAFIPRQRGEKPSSSWEGGQIQYDGRGTDNNKRYGFNTQSTNSRSDSDLWKKSGFQGLVRSEKEKRNRGEESTE